MKTHLLILFCTFGLFSFSQYVFLTTYCLLSWTVLLALMNSHSIFSFFLFFFFFFLVIDLFIACLLLSSKQPHSLDLLPGILLFFFLFGFSTDLLPEILLFFFWFSTNLPAIPAFIPPPPPSSSTVNQYDMDRKSEPRSRITFAAEWD